MAIWHIPALCCISICLALGWIWSDVSKFDTILLQLTPHFFLIWLAASHYRILYSVVYIRCLLPFFLLQVFTSFTQPFENFFILVCESYLGDFLPVVVWLACILLQRCLFLQRGCGTFGRWLFLLLRGVVVSLVWKVFVINPILYFILQVQFELSIFTHRVSLIIELLFPSPVGLCFQWEFDGVIACCKGLDIPVNQIRHLYALNVVEINDCKQVNEDDQAPIQKAKYLSPLPLISWDFAWHLQIEVGFRSALPFCLLRHGRFENVCDVKGAAAGVVT